MNGSLRFAFMRGLAASFIGLILSGATTAFDDLGQRATWVSSTADQAKEQVDGWLADQALTEAQLSRIEAIWLDTESLQSGQVLLDAVVTSLAVADPQAREIVLLCEGRREFVTTPEFEMLADESVAPFVRNNLRLHYGGWLTQQRLFDEALVVLNDLEPAQVVDPASLLFYQSASYHFLMEKEKGLETLAQLLEREDDLPLRYRGVARLMQTDLASLEADSLDEISRLMNDIERRLDFGRSGTRVLGEEDEVVAKLDRMIEELESAGSS